MVFLLLFLWGCFPKPGSQLIMHQGSPFYWEPEDFSIEVYFDASLSPEVIQDTLEAMDTWNSAVGAEVFVVGVPSFGDPPVCGFVNAIERDLQQPYKNVEAQPNHVIGLATFMLQGEGTDICTATVAIDSDAKKELFKNIMIHELGHALGLGHDTHDKNSIMYPSLFTDTPQFIRPDDVELVRSMMLGTFDPNEKKVGGVYSYSKPLLTFYCSDLK